MLVAGDVEFEGSDTWWFKGRYVAQTEEDAIHMAFDDQIISRPRSKAPTVKTRVALTGPEVGWHEFQLEQQPMPARIVAIEAKPSLK